MIVGMDMNHDAPSTRQGNESSIGTAPTDHQEKTMKTRITKYTMSQATTIGLGLIIVLLSAQPAGAVPAPKSEQEMMDMADLVVDATCVSVICQGPPVEDQEKFTTTYLSTLFPSFSYKGGLPNSFQIRGMHYDWKNPHVGGWHQEPVPEGFSGKFYLERLADGSYSEVWWNGIIEDPTSSHPKPLPDCQDEPTDGGVRDGQVTPDGQVAQDGHITEDGQAPDQDGGHSTGTADRGCSCRSTGSHDAPWQSVPIGFFILLALAWRRRRA